MNPNIYELSKMTKEQYDFIMKRAELDITGYELNLSDVNNKLKIYPKKHMINQKKKK